MAILTGGPWHFLRRDGPNDHGLSPRGLVWAIRAGYYGACPAARPPDAHPGLVRRRGRGVEYPIRVGLVRAGPVLPGGAVWWFEPKFDGHRAVLRRTEDAVILYARSGRIVTSHWMDLAVAAMQLRPGTTLDGEVVIWLGVASTSATPRRAPPSRWRAPGSWLTGIRPSTPRSTSWRTRSTAPSPHARTPSRRVLLADVLHDVGPPVQATPSTDSRTLALGWYETLQSQGVERIVANPGRFS
ncbi:hypothetical protein ACFXAY_20320 [Streptomyces microflavus]|uniref:ATP-dependent DNA ligase n=1 Tax=Streptomyces microflavus TaxID=1919 RepID=UPI00369E0740